MAHEHGHGHGHDAPPLPPEPKTPMWLPALGAALFLAAGLWWLSTPSRTTPVAAPGDAGIVADAAPAP